MITREQVADLQPGDVVEVHRIGWPEGATVRGPLYGSDGGGKGLWVGDLMVRHHDGDAFAWQAQKESTLTVLSRAPRPLYVNHPSTQPVPGDVVRDAVDDSPPTVWMYQPQDEEDDVPWVGPIGGSVETHWYRRDSLPARLRLLVDGETGQVVP